MASTTYVEFNDKTDSLEVAEKFAKGIHQKTILITGVNLQGIGFSTAQAFASQSPALLILAGRNTSRLQDCINALKKDYPDVSYRTLKLDLSSQKAVREAAAEFTSWTDVPKLDIQVNNAAIMNIPDLTFNDDGIEIQFGTNHIGHFLFTSLIMPKLIKASGSNPKGATRIINVTSLSPVRSAMRWSDPKYEKINHTLPENEQPNYTMHRHFGSTDPENKSYLPLEGYNQSKIGNVLFSIGLNQRLYEKYGILSYSVHPGVIQTELSRYAAPETQAAIAEMASSRFFTWKTLGQGAATTVVAALDPAVGLPGEKTVDGKTVENFGVYWIDCQPSDKANPLAVSSSEAERLWKYSEELVKERFEY